MYLVNHKHPERLCYALLFSTDIELDPIQLYEAYRARFQIEFIFRDAKQFTGLTDCQARDAQKLDFHFNASLTALNMAKWEQYQQRDVWLPFIFSFAKRFPVGNRLPTNVANSISICLSALFTT